MVNRLHCTGGKRLCTVARDPLVSRYTQVRVVHQFPACKVASNNNKNCSYIINSQSQHRVTCYLNHDHLTITGEWWDKVMNSRYIPRVTSLGYTARTRETEKKAFLSQNHLWNLWVTDNPQQCCCLEDGGSWESLSLQHPLQSEQLTQEKYRTSGIYMVYAWFTWDLIQGHLSCQNCKNN